MRLLHTGDWHVGKSLKGQSRADEHRAVLQEIVEIARDQQIDVALIAGDVFDSASPSPEAEQIAYSALLALAGTATHVVLIAGNHDNARRLAAIKPLLELTNVHVQAAVAPPEDGGVLTLTSKAGETLRLALLPFVSQRGIVRASELMGEDADQHAERFAERLSEIIARLGAGLAPDAINMLLGHAMVHGGVLGGGERSAHTVFEYSIPTTAFPAELHYVALGHLHRAQALPAACPVRYCGSPLQLDFGEEQDAKSVNIIDAHPGTPAKIEQIPLTAGRKLLTISGTLASLEARDDIDPDALLRVDLDESPRVGLGDAVRELLPNVIEVRLRAPARADAPEGPDTAGKSPRELFAQYLDGQDVADRDGLLALFDEILEEHHETEAN